MNSSYKTTISIQAPAERVFEAITKELGKWWGAQDRPIERKGTEFRVSWGEPWYQFKVVKYEPDVEVIWECTDANQLIPGLSGVEKEWVGTKIHWYLEEGSKSNTILYFEHDGLVPEVLCFDFCSKSWDHFLRESLVNYLRA